MAAEGGPGPKGGDGRRGRRTPVDLEAVVGGRAPRRARVADLSLVGCLLRVEAALARGAVLDLTLGPAGRPLAREGPGGRGLARRRGAAGSARLRRRARVPGARGRGRGAGCGPSSRPRRNGGGLRTRPLREARPRELRPLLDEEAALWHSELGWDFAEVRAAVVRRHRARHAAGPRGRGRRARRRLLLLHGRPRARDRRLDLRDAGAARPGSRGGARRRGDRGRARRARQPGASSARRCSAPPRAPTRASSARASPRGPATTCGASSRTRCPSRLPLPAGGRAAPAEARGPDGRGRDHLQEPPATASTRRST